jgi:hypothetical protein
LARPATRHHSIIANDHSHEIENPLPVVGRSACFAEQTMPNKIAAASPLHSLQVLVEQFVLQIVATVEAATTQRVHSAVVSALGNGGGSLFPRRRGRPPKNPLFTAALVAPARRRPKQLCPVPGCSNPAAPVFGMVCAKHKDLPKTKIKKYRAARRAAKAKK